MTNHDNRMVMKREAGVAHLKAHLSEVLRDVRRGHEVVINDRDQPIARIVPYKATGALVVREPSSVYATLGDIPMPRRMKLDHDPVDLLLSDRRRER